MAVICWDTGTPRAVREAAAADKVASEVAKSPREITVVLAVAETTVGGKTHRLLEGRVVERREEVTTFEAPASVHPGSRKSTLNVTKTPVAHVNV